MDCPYQGVVIMSYQQKIPPREFGIHGLSLWLLFSGYNICFLFKRREKKLEVFKYRQFYFL